MRALVGVIDYDSGNVASILNAFRKVGASVVLTSEEHELNACSHIVLPGVGSFSGAAQKLEMTIGYEIVKDLIEKKPFLGICVGMQLLGDSSEEFGARNLGLGVFQAKVRKLENAPFLPHVGWNSLIQISPQSRLLKGFDESQDFYFTHSYALDSAAEVTVARADYGGQFVAVIEQNETFGVQFHPEKSGEVGRKLLSNFVAL